MICTASRIWNVQKAVWNAHSAVATIWSHVQGRRRNESMNSTGEQLTITKYEITRWFGAVKSVTRAYLSQSSRRSVPSIPVQACLHLKYFFSYSFSFYNNLPVGWEVWPIYYTYTKAFPHSLQANAYTPGPINSIIVPPLTNRCCYASLDWYTKVQYW